MPIRWPACCASLSLCLLIGAVGLTASAVHAQTVAASAWRETATTEEQALDAAAFQPVEAALATQYPDVQSAVVVLRGRVVYRFYRDGEPEKLRDTQSASKSALSALLGTALAQGRIGSVDQRVVELMPAWAPLNPDPRAAIDPGFEYAPGRDRWRSYRSKE